MFNSVLGNLNNGTKNPSSLNMGRLDFQTVVLESNNPWKN